MEIKYFAQNDPNKLILWNFDLMGSGLKTSHKEKLREIISRWRGPLLRSEAIIQVTGHTSLGEDFHPEVASARSKMVKAYLCSHGIESNLILIKAVGKEHPLYNNLIEKGKERNRRVEIDLIKFNNQVHANNEQGIGGKQKSLDIFHMEKEDNWSDNNPQGMVTELDPGNFILWNFTIAKRDLKRQHQQKLLEVVKLVNKDTKIQITGHMSKNETEACREDLSLTRALEVSEYLQRHGVKKENLIISARGSSRPLFPNLTGQTMARNRRVELKLLNLDKQNYPRKMNVKVEPVKKEELLDAFGNKHFKMEELIPGQEYSVKYTKKLLTPMEYSIFKVTTYVELVGNVIIKTKSKLQFYVSGKINGGGISYSLKSKLDQHVTSKVNITEGKVSLKFDKLYFNPELELNVVNISKWYQPFSLTFNTLSYYWRFLCYAGNYIIFRQS